MALAKLERDMASRGEGCLGKAADDEPVFILRAQDKFASVLLRLWVELAQAARVNPAKVNEAISLEFAMLRWQHENISKVKTPD